MRMLRLSAGVAFVLAGVVGLVGCVWLPGGFQPLSGGPRPETQIGRAGSDKPLWVGRATPADVTRVLGQPTAAAPDGRTMSYDYTISTGAIVFICGFGLPTAAGRRLELEFDDSGVLSHYKVVQI